MNDRAWRGAERAVLLSLWGAVAAFALLMVAAGWPQYWRYIAAETVPLAWLESVLLALTAMAAGMRAFAAKATGEGDWAPRAWTAIAAGFALLSLDERFAVHERIRDRLLKPTGVRLLPWMEAGDWIIVLYALCGLAVAWNLWKLLAPRRAARAFFAAAVAIAAVAAGMDTIDIRSLDKGAERLLQSVEELLETASAASFLSAFLCAGFGRWREALENRPGAGGPSRDEPPAARPPHRR
jgi:hypothetical protein